MYIFLYFIVVGGSVIRKNAIVYTDVPNVFIFLYGMLEESFVLELVNFFC